MSFFVGVDLSLDDTGYAVLKLGKEPSIAVDSIVTKPDGFPTVDARLAFILNQVDNLVQDTGGNALVILEGLSLGSFGATSSLDKLAGLHYMLRARLVECNRTFVTVPPSTLKKFTCGAGNAQKNMMLLKVYQRYNVETPNDNIADAVALAYFGASYAGEWDLRADQKELMASFKAGPKVKAKKKRK